MKGFLKASFLVPSLTIYVSVTPELSFPCEWTNLFSDEFAGSMNSGLLLTIEHYWKAVLSFNALDINLNKEMATNICGFLNEKIKEKRLQRIFDQHLDKGC